MKKQTKTAGTKNKTTGPQKKSPATRKKAATAAPAKKVRPPSPDDVRELQRRLTRTMQGTVVELDFADAWQLLIATILSAQSTDKTVNRVTPELFRRYPTPAKLAAAPQEEVEEVVRATGFFRNKAKSIRSTSQALLDHFGGEVPRTLDELVTLPGVARKTANVVLGAAFGIASGIVVDTHAGRVSRRLGLSAADDPVKIEADLCAAFPRAEWIEIGSALVLHGRYVCTAKKPACPRCPVNELCPSREAAAEGSWQARADDENALVRSRGEG